MSKYNGLENKKFGKLLALKETEERLFTSSGKIRNAITYKCECDCGNKTLASGYDLFNNVKQSCGCIKVGGKNKKDLSGKRFGKILVLKEDKEKIKLNDKDTAAYWICKCDCGNTKSISGVSLRNGATNGCGCGARLSPKNNLLGEKFDRLLVINREKNSTRGLAKWECQCDCGSKIIATGVDLRARRKLSCGCIDNSSSNNKKWRGIGKVSRNYYTKIKNGATKRNLEFSISHRYLWLLLLKQNYKCALSGIKISEKSITASLDRINSTMGYIKGNIQWVHKDVNRIKMDMEEYRFIEWCRMITEYKYK